MSIFTREGETALATTNDAARDASAKAPRGRRLGLAGRLLALTLGAVLVAQSMLYAVRLSAFRDNWLHERLVAAQSAALVFGADRDMPLPPDLTKKILDTVSAKMIAIDGPSEHLVLSVAPNSPKADFYYDLANPSLLEGVDQTLRTLFATPGSILHFEGPAPVGDANMSVTIDQAPLIAALWRVSRNFLTISLTLSTVVALVLWAAIWQMVLRPVSRLTSSIIAFGQSPQEAHRIVTHGGRDDEIGRAEAALAAMQGSLARELAQRKRLSELGMAVARINHDLRNMLAAAQLISDRLAAIPDPLAQRLAPRLVATLDRAILFCQSTLTYGAARDEAPARRRFDLRELVRQIVETAEATGAGAISYSIDIPPKFELYADPDHVQRIVENLSRNAAQALQNQGARGDRPPAIRFAAIRTEGAALIEVSDTGPGFAPEQTARIFEPFHLTTREGGSGLGLAIAADLVARNDGSIALTPAQTEDFYCGARFLITLPVPQEATRPSLAAPES